MKSISGLLLLSLMITSCYQAPKLDGFDQEQWKSFTEDCENSRVEGATLLVSKFDLLKGSSQNEMRALLGKENRHELFKRNQKFFYFDLTCNGPQKQELRLRFDALGALREANIEWVSFESQ